MKTSVIRLGVVWMAGLMIWAMAASAQAVQCSSCAYITGGKSVYVWEPSANTTSILFTIPAAGTLDSLIFDLQGNIIVGDAPTGRVYIYNPSVGTPTVLADLPGSDVADFALEPGGATILAAGRGDNTIYRINLATKAKSTLYHGLNPDGIAYDNTGRLFAVLGRSSSMGTGIIAQLDPVDGHVIKQISGLNKPDGLTFSTTTLTLYAASLAGGFYTVPTDLSAAVFTNVSNKAIDGLATAGRYLYLVNYPFAGIKYDLITNQELAISPNIPDADDIAPVSGLGSLTPPKIPHLSALVPDHTVAGSPDFTLTLNGSDFVNGAVVSWNGSARTTTFVSDAELRAVISAADVANPTTANVRVTNPDTQVSNTLPFSVTAQVANLTSIRVTPLVASRHPGQTVSFTAQGYDQNNQPMSGITFTWSLPQNNSGAAIAANGVYTAGSSGLPATDTIAAASSGLIGNAQVTVDNDPAGNLTINSVTANPNPVPGKTTALNVSATGPAGETLSYLWTRISGPAAVALNTPTAADSMATFTVPGVYVFQARVNSSGGRTLTGSVTVTVVQTVTQVIVDPGFASIRRSEHSFNFTKRVVDQFGQVMPSETVTWDASGGGSISQAGIFQSNDTVHHVTITARSDSRPTIVGTATLEVQGINAAGDFDISDAHAYPVPWKSTMPVPFVTFTGLKQDTEIRLFTTSGRIVRKLYSGQGEDVQWMINNDSGERIASGVYFYIIDNKTSGQTVKGKVVIIK